MPRGPNSLKRSIAYWTRTLADDEPMRHRLEDVYSPIGQQPGLRFIAQQILADAVKHGHITGMEYTRALAILARWEDTTSAERIALGSLLEDLAFEP